jgi:capsular polysaccharide biosynthesis protein
MELREIFQIIKKRSKVIVLITLATILITAIFNFFILDDIYETHTTLMVSKTHEGGQTPDIQYNDILLNQKLVKTYSTIATSNRVIEQVIEDLNIEADPEDVKEKITVTSIGETEIIKISVLDKDKEFGVKLANATANAFMDAVVDIMKLDNVQVIDVAKLPERPVKPRRALNLAVAAVLGVMIGLGVAFLQEYLDNTIKTPDDVEKYLGVPVLGVIPSIDE